MTSQKAKKIEKVVKKTNKTGFALLVTVLSSLIILFSLNISSHQISRDFLQSIKETVETVKPTEELFDDSGGVKLVSILFPITTREVSNQLLNFKFKLDGYDNYSSNGGLITFYNPSGIIYASESGNVKITEVDDDCDELKIIHALNTETIYSGKFIFGVKDGQYIEKGAPLAVVLSPKLEFCITNNGEIISEISLVQGELVWRD